MHVVVEGASGEVEVDVVVRQPQATVGDLAEALAVAVNGRSPQYPALTIDRHRAQPDQQLADTDLYPGRGAAAARRGSQQSRARFAGSAELGLAVCRFGRAGRRFILAARPGLQRYGRP